MNDKTTRRAVRAGDALAGSAWTSPIVRTVECRGTTLEAAFERAAEAIFAMTTEPGSVAARRTVALSFIETDEVRALARWIVLLLELADEHALAFSEFHLLREGAHWRGCATGEPVRDTLPTGVRIAEAGPADIAVEPRSGEWKVRFAVATRQAPVWRAPQLAGNRGRRARESA